MSKSIVPFAGVLIALCAVAAHAQTAPEAQRAVVRYADLDLSHASGQKILVSRIDAAAAHVCGDEPRTADLARFAAYRHCLGAARDSGMAQMQQVVARAAGVDGLAIQVAEARGR